MLYLDYAASAPVCEEALVVLEESMRCDFANPSSAHKLGKGLTKRIDVARAFFLTTLKAKKTDSLTFVSSATEANNTVICGHDLVDGDEVLFCSADHPSTVNPVRSLVEKGVKIIELPLGQCGQINISKISNLVNEKTKLVVLTQVNNQSGNIQDIDAIAREVKAISKCAHIHVDAVQSYSKIIVDLSSRLVDSLVISGHKIHGPKGIAALYVKEGAKVKPLLLGGGHEYGMRSSTPAAPLIFSFAEAAKVKTENVEESYEELRGLNSWLREELVSCHRKITFPFPLELTSPYILTFVMPGISSDILLRHFESKDVYISSSSACSSKIKGTNPVFSALGINDANHKFVLRLSFASTTTKEELEKFVNKFKAMLDDLSILIKG